MADLSRPLKNVAFDLGFTLYKSDGTVIANPGTYTKKIWKDGGAAADISGSVTETDTTYGVCVVQLSATEMNADRVQVYIKDDTTGCVPFTCTIYPAAANVPADVVNWKGSAAAVMTGDAYARLGAPAGASVSADVAAVKTDTAAVKTQTDKLAFTVANKIDANVYTWNGTAVATPATAGYPVCTNKVGTGTGEINLASGKAPATIAVGDLANNCITAAAIANAAIDNATFAADVGSTAYASNIMALATDKALVNRNLDHLVAVATAGTDMTTEVVDGSIISRIISNSDTSLFVPATHNLVQQQVESLAVKTQTDKMAFTVANQIDSNVIDWKGSAAPAMTGDAYARLGAPAGASVSADIADMHTDVGTVNTNVGDMHATDLPAVKTVVDAIKVKTDKLQFDTSNYTRASVEAIKGASVTEGGPPDSGYLAAGFTKFFNIASPTSTMEAISVVTTVTSGVTVTTNNDKTGYTVSTVSDKTGYSLAANQDVRSVTSGVAGSVGSVVGSVGSVAGNVDGNVTGSVGSLATQAKTDVTGAVPTAAVVADAVWDEAHSGHVSAGSTGLALSGASAPTAAAVADAVWDEAASGHTTAATFGKYLGGASAGATIAADIADLHTDISDIHTDVGTAITNIGDIHATDLPAVKTVVDAVKVQTDKMAFTTANKIDARAFTVDDKTGYTASTVSDKTGYSLAANQDVRSVTSGVAGSVGSVVGNVGGSVASVTAGVTVTTNNDKTGYALTAAYDPAKNALATSGYTTPPTVAAIRAEIDSNSTQLSGIKTKTDSLTFTTANKVDARAFTVDDKTGYTVSTVSDKTGYSLAANQDVRSVTSGVAGSVGSVVGNVGGSVASVTAAVTVGTNNDKTGYSLSVTPPTAAAIRTEMDSNSTKLANLDTTVSSRLATSGYTAPANSDITAIKNKTDNLPASPAAVGSAMTLAANQDVRSVTSGVAGAVGSVTGNVGGNVVGSVASVTGNVGGSVASVTGAVGSVTSGVTVATNNDKTGYALTTGERASIATQVESQIINDADSNAVLTAITDKIASVNPSLGGLTLSGIAAQVRTNLTTELGMLDTPVSSRLATSGYTAPSNSDITAIKTKTDSLTFTTANKVDARAFTVDDKTGYTASTVSDKTGYSLAANQDVRSVTSGVAGSVGSVVGSVGSVTAGVTVTTNNDKTGYSLSVTPPTAAAIRTEMDSNSTKLANLDTTVSSRLATSGYTAPPAAATNASAVRTELGTELGRIDTTISSRLATSGYTAPPTATAVRAEMDSNSTKLANLDTTVGSRLATSGYTAPPAAATNASAVRTELTTELGRIDTTVSSRLATSGYTAPANSDITAIKNKTDNLPASPAAVGSNMGTVVSVTSGVTVTTNNDKTGYALTAAYDAAKTASSSGAAATAVWSNGVRTLTSSGASGATAQEVWEYATRSLTSGVTVGTISDKTGYALTADYDSAKTAASQTSVNTISSYTSGIPSAAANASAVRTELTTELGRLDTTVSSRLATSGYTAPANSDITAIKNKTDNLPAVPAAVGSNMGTVISVVGSVGSVTSGVAVNINNDKTGYSLTVAPPTAAAIRTEIDANSTKLVNLDTTVSSRLATSGYTTPPAAATNASAVRTELGTELGRIDAAISSRLATSGYTAPANSDITAIKNKTDNLPASPAAVGSAMTLAANQDVRSVTSGVAGSVGSVLGAVGSVTSGVTVTTNNDKSGYSLTAAYDPAKTAAQAGNAMTLTTGERTAIANEVEAQIIDETDSEKVLTAITNKIASVNPSLGDLTLSGIAAQVRTNLTTELGRIDASVSSRLATSGYTAPANSDITAIKNKTDNLPASPAAVGSAMTLAANQDVRNVTGSVTGSVGSVTSGVAVNTVADKTGYSLTAAYDAAKTASSGTAPTVTAIRQEMDANSTKLSNLDVSVSSRLATSGYTAPPAAATNATAVRSELATELGRLDMSVSSRLAASGYTAPDNALLTAVDSFVHIIDSNTSGAAVVDASEIAGAVRTELASELARVDVPVSSRLATTGYTEFVNPNIALIKAKTDQLTFTITGRVDATAALSQEDLDSILGAVSVSSPVSAELIYTLVSDICYLDTFLPGGETDKVITYTSIWQPNGNTGEVFGALTASSTTSGLYEGSALFDLTGRYVLLYSVFENDGVTLSTTYAPFTREIICQSPTEYNVTNLENVRVRVLHEITNVPLRGVNVWITTDEEGTDIIDGGYTDSNGYVSFNIPSGTVYVWKAHYGTHFVNPTQIVVVD